MVLLVSMYNAARVNDNTSGRLVVDAFVLDKSSVSTKSKLNMVKRINSGSNAPKSASGAVVVTPVVVPTPDKNIDDIPQFTKELADLADVRYDEFVAHHDEVDLLGLQKPPPSRTAFRMATAEVAQERLEQATSFLAKLDGAAVGAAELSQAELEGALIEKMNAWYITDVVTAREHRRKGIASALLDALERHAVVESSNHDKQAAAADTTLYLHVKQENDAANAFYKSRGYAPPTDDQLKRLNADMLATNAGTEGQVLLSKIVTSEALKKSLANSGSSTASNSSGGFGGTGVGMGAKTPKKKGKRKKK